MPTKKKKKKYPDKDYLQLSKEFEENGYVEHICPDCGEETNPTEIDNPQAYCETCEELKKVEPLL